MKTIKILTLVLFTGLMVYAATDLPNRADNNSAMHAEISPNGGPVIGNYFIQNAYKDAKTPNIVTVILGDYRGIDTFGEQLVIFTAGLVGILVLRKSKKLKK
ncbi:MAG TPA: hypothetical protein DCE78_02105 [Bacteroidetes bacterium]|nr:hypothetical protein [Bacteroidota bacterium]